MGSTEVHSRWPAQNFPQHAEQRTRKRRQKANSTLHRSVYTHRADHTHTHTLWWTGDMGDSIQVHYFVRAYPEQADSLSSAAAFR